MIHAGAYSPRGCDNYGVSSDNFVCTCILHDIGSFVISPTNSLVVGVLWFVGSDVTIVQWWAGHCRLPKRPLNLGLLKVFKSCPLRFISNAILDDLIGD